MEGEINVDKYTSTSDTEKAELSPSPPSPEKERPNIASKSAVMRNIMEFHLGSPQEDIESFDEYFKSMPKLIERNKRLSAILQTFEQAMAKLGQELIDKNHGTLRILIVEEPLTAYTLSAIIAAITDLHARCWFIQQNRFADLIDYAQTRNPDYLKQANLQIGILSHNSPALIDFLITSGTGIAGATTLALAIKIGIDAVLQTPQRFEEAKLKNEREKLNQKIAAQKAEAENRTLEQEQKIAAQKAQIELEKQQLELDQQRLEFQQNRVKVILEIATTVVSQLQSDSDVGQREMIIHSLVPPFLQLAATETIMITKVLEPTDEKNKESSEDK